MSDDSEQREYTRFNVDWPERIVVENGVLSDIVIRNISLGGLQFRGDTTMSRGRKVKVEMRPPLREANRMRALLIAVHTTLFSDHRGMIVGARFVILPKPDKEMLRTTLQKMGAENENIAS